MKLSVLSLVSLSVLVTSVIAHSTLERSEPKNGETLKQSPNELRIWFSEPIKPAFSTIQVRDAAGKQVDQRDLRADATDPVLIHLSLPQLAKGNYQVTWTVVARDLHVTKGSFTFQIAP